MMKYAVALLYLLVFLGFADIYYGSYSHRTYHKGMTAGENKSREHVDDTNVETYKHLNELRDHVIKLQSWASDHETWASTHYHGTRE